MVQLQTSRTSSTSKQSLLKQRPCSNTSLKVDNLEMSSAQKYFPLIIRRGGTRTLRVRGRGLAFCDSRKLCDSCLANVSFWLAVIDRTQTVSLSHRCWPYYLRETTHTQRTFFLKTDDKLFHRSSLPSLLPP